MKTLFKNAGKGILFLAIIGTVASCTKDNGPVSNNNNSRVNLNTANLQNQITSLPVELLNTTELNTLLFMREEEKLARDVYTTLYNKWGVYIFSNISKSEQTHMDALLMLLNKYGLPDPAGFNAIGVFGNATLQNLYTQLVAQGNISLLDAYKVGAAIEDLDIFDLNTALTTIDNRDIRLVYDNLTKGSCNHMRSLYKNIVSLGSSYTPQYITPQAFDVIIKGAMETGF